MKKEIKSLFLKIIFPVFAGIILTCGIIYAASSWIGPTSAPPGDNASAPINVSNSAQLKAGALGLNGPLHGYSDAIFDGKVGIGYMVPTNKLDVGGKIRATDDICTDKGGGKCLSDAGMPAGAIIMWSGSAGNIPSGWALCDGSAQTVGGKAITVPDLRNKFVLGAISTANSGQDYSYPLSAVSYSYSYSSGTIGGDLYYPVVGTGQPGGESAWIIASGHSDWMQLYPIIDTTTYTWTYVSSLPTYTLAFIIKL